MNLLREKVDLGKRDYFINKAKRREGRLIVASRLTIEETDIIFERTTQNNVCT